MWAACSCAILTDADPQALARNAAAPLPARTRTMRRIDAWATPVQNRSARRKLWRERNRENRCTHPAKRRPLR